MTVKLEQYRIFKAIADTGNISRTAKQLYLSQSAVSQSLQQLESALGVRLFSRTARGVTLTAEGSVLYDYAAQALSLLEAGEARIAQSRELLKGELSIGVSSTLTIRTPVRGWRVAVPAAAQRRSRVRSRKSTIGARR